MALPRAVTMGCQLQLRHARCSYAVVSTKRRCFNVPRSSRRLQTRAFAAQAGANSEADKDAQLAKAWQGCSTLAFAAGSLSIPVSDPLRVFYTPQSTPNSSAVVPGLVTFPMQQAADAPTSSQGSAVHGLLKAAAPSPFGKGKETVYDPSVRTAAELKASQLGINKLLPPPEVLDQVRLLLQPNAPSVVAELDKLNIYGPGGFFKPHFDTPRAGDHFGTLIICLPSPFAGGQLVLRHIDHNSSSPPLSHTFDWAKQLNDPAGQQALQWAAFYNDTEHEVLPVTEGHRITLTYNLRAPLNPDGADVPYALNVGLEDDEVPLPRELPTEPFGKEQLEDDILDSSWMTAVDVSCSSGLTAQLKQLLADKAWHTQGDCLGFVLQHKYCSGLKRLSSLSFPEALKGPDRVLYAALQQAGLKPRVVPLFLGWGGWSTDWFNSEEEEEREAEEGQSEAKGAWNNFGRPLQPAQQKDHPTSEDTMWYLLVGDFQSCASTLSEGGMIEGADSEDTAHTVEDLFGGRVDDIAWVTPVLEEHFTYHSSVLAGENEASEVWIHSTAAILVDVPDWQGRNAQC